MHGIKRQFVKLMLLVPLLVGLPLVGIILKGEPIALYLEFPPTTRAVVPSPFSESLFFLLAIFIIIVITPFVLRLFSVPKVPQQRVSQARAFPWWGWTAVGFLIVTWTLAWTRFSWFQEFQPHTFTPLWLGYILVINALTYTRTGQCLMLDHPRKFLTLFPLSAGFWWFFEYLNRYVHNWYYPGIGGIDALNYLLFMTISFSTVLPAVFGTYEWLASFSRLNLAFQNWWKIPIPQGAPFGWILLLPACLGLIGVAMWSQILYPLLWISPLFILLGLQGIFGEENLLTPLKYGDWRSVTFPALAALICGYFWEMWNYYSLLHWEYAIPYVHTFTLFEMPLLGYSGYLPFGLECVAFIQFMLFKRLN